MSLDIVQIQAIRKVAQSCFKENLSFWELPLCCEEEEHEMQGRGVFRTQFKAVLNMTHGFSHLTITGTIYGEVVLHQMVIWIVLLRSEIKPNYLYYIMCVQFHLQSIPTSPRIPLKCILISIMIFKGMIILKRLVTQHRRTSCT